MDDREAFDVWFENYHGDNPDYWTHKDIEAAWQAARAYEAERVKGLVEALDEVKVQMRDNMPLSEDVCNRVDKALAAYQNNGCKLSPSA